MEYSLTDGSGRPGWPVLVILHWQVYSRVQEEAESSINKAAAAVKKDVERFFIELDLQVECSKINNGFYISNPLKY